MRRDFLLETKASQNTLEQYISRTCKKNIANIEFYTLQKYL